MTKDQFSNDFIKELEALFTWRRDVRHFKSDPVSSEILDHLLSIAYKAPSVGLSEPWRFVKIETPEYRQKIYNHFLHTNQQAANHYHNQQKELYTSLKLSGLKEAPHHIAVFSERNPHQGKGLGRQTMPQTTVYSTVMAIFSFWLAARAYGVGVGWVSILSPHKIHKILDIPEDQWEFIAYLCVGYPQFTLETPELEKRGWEKRSQKSEWISK